MMIICETSIHCSLQDNQPSFFLTSANALYYYYEHSALIPT